MRHVQCHLSIIQQQRLLIGRVCDSAWYVIVCQQATDRVVTLSSRSFMEEVVEQRAWGQEAAAAPLQAAPVIHPSAAALHRSQPPIILTLLCAHPSPVLSPISFWKRTRRSQRPTWIQESPSHFTLTQQSKQSLAPPQWIFWWISALRDLQLSGLQLLRVWPRSWLNVCHGHTCTLRALPWCGAPLVVQMQSERAATAGLWEQDKAPPEGPWWRTGLLLSCCQRAQTMKSMSMSSSSKFLLLRHMLW